MATKADYYDTLGVQRGADEAEIKRSFRRLARELHPDVNAHDPEADAKFRAVAEAYEVLSDPEKRARYDRFGHAGMDGGGSRASQASNIADIFSMFFGEDVFGGGGFGPTPGADLGAEVELDLKEAALGTRTVVRIEALTPCERCGASGAEPPTQPTTCDTCRGAGQVQQVTRTVLGQMMRTMPCPHCRGRGRTVETPCTDCRGEGRRYEPRELDVTIPGGIESGQRIRVTGQGHAGDVGAPAGDLYVLVRVRDDPRFHREGKDLVTVVDVTFTEAALGVTVAVPTLEGDEELALEPGVQPGDVRVLRGRGAASLRGGRRGDLRVAVNVRVPRRLAPEQRRLVEELDAALAEDAYADGDGGFMGRFKRRFRDGR